ncbi:glutamate racemase [Glaciimonas soli]|uniref:Glutamate racemase n=1 Tax=Glaciimonas soli TaxID=2590999 RepID=A0A843YMM7_9BURK|nr:glutamate racemase [Glaciimonas soli]MQR01129.1 glutamate racemase [Glaciimonas soli]
MNSTMPMESPAITTLSAAPIGIFDSGIGGLSVLRHIRRALPNENLVYFADSGYAPYGDKTEQEIIERTLSITAFLQQQRAKALVIACNTATAAAIKIVRSAYPALPIVGVEPGLKPAAQQTHSKIVGVLATKSTLASAPFTALMQQISLENNVQFELQACVGLVDQIERGQLHEAATEQLIERYVAPLIKSGADTLVLGCTHYPFVQPLIEKIIKRLTDNTINIIDTGDAVTRQLLRVLMTLQHSQSTKKTAGDLIAYTSGNQNVLKTAFSQLLLLHPTVLQAPNTETADI